MTHEVKFIGRVAGDFRVIQTILGSSDWAEPTVPGLARGHGINKSAATSGRQACCGAP